MENLAEAAVTAPLLTLETDDTMMMMKKLGPRASTSRGTNAEGKGGRGRLV